MYARQPPDGRFQRNVQVPRNYSGNAFRQEKPSDKFLSQETEPPLLKGENDIEEQEKIDTDEKDTPKDEKVKQKTSEETSPVGRSLFSPGFKLDLGRFFNRRDGFGIGFEELLIIGLIFLISQSDSKDDLIFLLFLLLFIQ